MSRGGVTMAAYQDAALRTWNPNGGDDRSDLAYLALGLIGESGEVAEQIKKHFRHGHALDVTHLEEELGDVLWYVAVLADALGVDLDQVAGNNVDKLKRRYPEGFSEKHSRERAVISETLRDL